MSWVLAVFVAATSLVHAQGAAPPDSANETALDGREIGEIRLFKGDVFDLSDPRENKRLYRLANRLHIVTKDSVIRQQLLLAPGDSYEKRLAEESERLLRSNNYLYTAAIKPVARDDGKVDLEVTTRDVWTFQPALSLTRKGGENETSFGLEELNLFGRGQTLILQRFEDVDRTSNILRFRDRNLGDSWIAGSLSIADNSDGHSHFVSIARPFYALDTRWSAGVTALDDDRENSLYALGDEVAEYRSEREYLTLSAGWSQGIRNGWIRRFSAGFVVDENRFSPVSDGTLPTVLPADRDLRYPFIGIEILQDRFDTSRNREQIARTEDFYMGTRLTASVGFASDATGADRDATIYGATLSRGFGSLENIALLVSASASGRIESGETRNALARVNGRFFWQQSDKRVFFTGIDARHGHSLDFDNTLELGGNNGLRGYPLRYQSGDARMLFTVEQRYYWNWYPWRIFRVGGAVFADVGRTWGDNPVGAENLGWLRDVGIGLRFASTRTGVRKVIHLDIAVPLDGDASIDDVQVVLESKRSF